MDVSSFVCREHELAQLEQWVLDERSRMVALLGMGGIGKTALATTFAHRVAAQFEVVIWRSLQHAPSLEQVLNDCLHLLGNQPMPSPPQDLDQRLPRLIEGLRQRRCLLVLDNVETLFQSGERAGSYRPGFEEYRTLFLRVGESAHQSCLLLTSRETLAELDLLGTKAPVRVLKVTGLPWEESRAVLQDEMLFGEPQDWRALSERYAGNPLALKIVTGEVRALFGGDIAAFLREGHLTFHGVRALLREQVERLSALEQEVLYWLAIERDLTPVERLRADMLHEVSPGDLLEALSSLRRRSLIERGERGAVFTLQPVILEYVTDRLAEQVAQEILAQRPLLLLRHALLQAEAKDYIRSSQGQLILQVVLHRLLIHLHDKHLVEKCLDLLLQQLRAIPLLEQRYGGGNVVNLLVRLNGHVNGKDCSRLMIRQADLREAEAQDATFAGADLRESAFLETINGILSAAISADGSCVAGGTTSGEIHIWRTTDGRPLVTLAGHTRHVWSVAFHPDGALLASGGFDGLVKVWAINGGQCLNVLQGHTRWVRSVAFHPAGKLLATSSNDGSIRLWNVAAGRCIKVWDEQRAEIWAVAFSPDGRLLASGNAAGVVKLWDFTSEQCLRTITVSGDLVAPGPHGVVSIAFSPDSELLVSGGMDARIRVWETSSGQHLSTLTEHSDVIFSVAFNADGLLASGSHDGTVKLWQVGHRGEAAQYLGTLQEHGHWIWSVALGPGGLLASGSHGGIMKLWQVNRDGTGGKCLRTFSGYSRVVEAVALSPDGSLLASGENNGTVRMWETKSGKPLRVLLRQGGELPALAFSPNGRLLAHASSESDTVKLWDVNGGQYLKALRGHQSLVWSLAFSPDSRFLVSGSLDTTIRLWDLGSGRCLSTLEGHATWVWSVAFNADGTKLASGDGNGMVKIWDIGSGACLRTLHGDPQAILALAFSPDGQMLLSSNARDPATTWEVQSGRRLRTLSGMGESYWLGSVAWSADGTFLAVASADQTVKVWDVSRGQLLHALPCPVGRPWSVSWSADQRLLACGADEGTIILWEKQTARCLLTLRSERPYERMDISGVTGITDAQRASLTTLGAIEASRR